MIISAGKGLLAASLGKAGVYLGRFCCYQETNCGYWRGKGVWGGQRG